MLVDVVPVLLDVIVNVINLLIVSDDVLVIELVASLSFNAFIVVYGIIVVLTVLIVIS